MAAQDGEQKIAEVGSAVAGNRADLQVVLTGCGEQAPAEEQHLAAAYMGIVVGANLVATLAGELAAAATGQEALERASEAAAIPSLTTKRKMKQAVRAEVWMNRLTAKKAQVVIISTVTVVVRAKVTAEVTAEVWTNRLTAKKAQVAIISRVPRRGKITYWKKSDLG